MSVSIPPGKVIFLGNGNGVIGPSAGSSTDNAIARWDGTTGRLLQNSVITIADTTGAMSGWTSGNGLTMHGGGTITGASGSLDFTASGTNQNITWTPSGAGSLVAAGNILPSTANNKNLGALASAWATAYIGTVNSGGNNFTLSATGVGATIVLQTTTGGGSLTTALTLDASQNATFAANIYGSVQALSGAGAVNVTTTLTNYTSTGVAEALTLANGTNGQYKSIVHVVDGGSGVLTPTTALGYTTITFAAAGDSVDLRYTSQGWAIVGSRGVVIA